MDAAINTLMVILAASRLDGTQVLVSIPEGDLNAQHLKILEAIANVSIQEKVTQKDLSELKSEMKAIKDVLKEVMNGFALKLKTNPASTSEPALISTQQPGSTPEPSFISMPEPPTCLGDEIVDFGWPAASSYNQDQKPYKGFYPYDRPYKKFESWASR